MKKLAALFSAGLESVVRPIIRERVLRRILASLFALQGLAAFAQSQTPAQQRAAIDSFLSRDSDAVTAVQNFLKANFSGFVPAQPPTLPAHQSAPPANNYGPQNPPGPKAGIPIPAGAVLIQPGDNWQTAIDAHGGGTTFEIAAGIHSNVSISPKSADAFIGHLGATVDGGKKTAQFLPGNSASNVILQNLIIRNYITPQNQGTVHLCPGLKVLDCEVSGSTSAGVYLGSDEQMQRCWLHGNGQYGFGAYEATGAIVVDCEISGNGSSATIASYASGGCKWYECANCTMSNCSAHDNPGGPQIWFDSNNDKIVCQNNFVANSPAPGIEFEISYTGSILNNVVENCRSSPAFAHAAGIFVYNSEPMITGNVVTNCDEGIGLKQSDRGTGSQGIWLTQNNAITGNIVTGCTVLSGIEWAGGPDPTQQNNHWQGNIYRGTGNNTPFLWGSGRTARSWQYWQAIPQDSQGTFTP